MYCKNRARIVSIWILSFACLSPFCMRRAEAASPTAQTRIDSANEFVDHLASGNFASATREFDKAMIQALPPAKLKQTWNLIMRQAGIFRRKTGAREEKQAGYDIVFVTCEFKKTSLDAKVVFDHAGKISGLFFVPARPAVGKWAPPKYAKPALFREQEVVVGQGTLWGLPGTLTLPKGNGPFAAIVLVHGSGPQDRDETIGPNKPFRDLAWGLASRGVAVLRYEKRTKEHPKKMALLAGAMTVKEETVDDALAAVALLRQTASIDPKRIFVLGHSLGGMLAPRIVARDKDLAGLIILAGTSRPFEDVILEQYNYIFSLDGNLSGLEKEELEKLKKQVSRVKNKNLSSATPAAQLPLSVPASYWLDLRDYDPVRTAKTLRLPILILQGERDYNVTMADFARWRKGLPERENVQFKTYPDLNHLFAKGEGKSVPAEYEAPGHVSKEVIDDIARWCANKGR